MTPGDVAAETARILKNGPSPLSVTVEHVPGMPNGQVRVWLVNGYGVSLINWSDHTYPELMIVRDDHTGWTVERAVSVWSLGEIRSTDPRGVLREATSHDAAGVLRALAWWNEGRHWSDG